MRKRDLSDSRDVRDICSRLQRLARAADAAPLQVEVDLADGDLLFFFTDGLLGARSARAGNFEDHLVGELTARAGLAPNDLVDGMRSAVLGFTGGDLHDDMTMLALRAAGEPPTR